VAHSGVRDHRLVKEGIPDIPTSDDEPETRLAARGVSQFLCKPLRRFNDLRTNYWNFWTSAPGC
jgi:hypothetical protein